MTDVAIAIDIGGTKVDAALVTADGVVLAPSRHRAPTGRNLDHDGMRTALSSVISGALSALTANMSVVGVGVGTAGPFAAGGEAIEPVNMAGVHGFRLADEVAGLIATVGAGATPARVVTGHDGGCLALAEAWIGAARDTRSSLSMVVSTGVGAGVVMRGQLLRGASGNAGHLGQTRIAGGRMLEEVAAGPASVAWAQAQGWQGSSGEDLRDALAAGDPIAIAAVERSADAVGEALANAATLLDLDVVVIGGGFSHVVADYTQRVQASLARHAALPYAAATRVVRSGLGGDGPLIGAASLVLRA